jgi:hypothetical protein
MTTPDTRPREMSEEQVQRLLTAIAGMQGAGAKIQVTDRRLSALQTGVLAIAGTLFLGICTWGVLKITTLSEVAQQLLTQNTWIIDQIRDHEQRIREGERRRGQ